MGQDATEGPTTVGPTPDAFHHITWDAVLVVSHLTLRPSTLQTEVEDGGDLTASPSPRGEGASKEGVQGLEENVGSRVLSWEMLLSQNKRTQIKILLHLPFPRPVFPPAAAFPLINSPPHRPLPSVLDSASAPPCCPTADQTGIILVTSSSPSQELSGRQPCGKDKVCVYL